MKPGYGKSKGGSFEREICKKLSLWVSANTRDDIFWRSAMSGGRASVKFKKGEQNLTQQGDISAIDPGGHFFIEKFIVECKFYKNLYLENLIFNTSKNGVISFWNTLIKLTAASNKIPFLVAKQNHKNPILLTSLEVRRILKYYNYKDIAVGNFSEMVIYDFERFLSVVDPIIFTKES